MRHLVFGVASLCLAGPANAAVQLDQEYFTVVQPGSAPVTARVGQVPPPASRPNDPATNVFAVQTFTAGLNGTLSSLSFQAASFGPAQSNGTFAIALIDGDYIAGARAGVFEDYIPFQFAPTLSIAGTGVLALNFDVSVASYKVTVGQRYSVLFFGLPSAPNQFGGLVIGQATIPGPNPPVFSGPGYQGGQFQTYVNGSATAPSNVYDVGFRSFVDVSAAVPEPGTWAMMILGFGAVGAAMRRRGATAKAVRTRLTYA